MTSSSAELGPFLDWARQRMDPAQFEQLRDGVLNLWDAVNRLTDIAAETGAEVQAELLAVMAGRRRG